MDLGMSLLKNRMEKRLLALEEDMYTATKKDVNDLDDFGYPDSFPRRSLYSAWFGDLLELLVDFEDKNPRSLVGDINTAIDRITKAIHQAKIPGLLDYRLHEIRRWKNELLEWLEMDEEEDFQLGCGNGEVK